MLSLADIKFEIVEQENFITKLSEYPKGSDVAFDYETYNDVNSEMAIEPWDENTFPFMFSVCQLNDPENTLKIFNFKDLTEEQKDTFEKFLTTRHVWAFNCKFESAVTWKLLGKPIRFDDVQCLYKVSGQFVDGLSLKKGTASLLGVPEWADDTWETLKVLREIVKRVQKVYVDKSKSNELVEAFFEGNAKRAYQIVEAKANSSMEKITKADAEFITALKYVKPILTPKVILNALKESKIDTNKVNLKYVPKKIVERYCAYDAYATAYNYQKLYDSCKEQYHIYLKQSWLAMIMEAYGMTRDLEREKEIESHYQDKILYYMKELLQIPEFTNTLEIEYYEDAINPETGRMKKFAKYRTGFEIEDHALVKETTNYELLKEKYWNYNSSMQSSLKLYYNALFSSDMAMSSVVAYHIKKFLVQLEGFTEIIDGQEISKAKRIKWDNIADLYPDAVKHIHAQIKNAKNSEDRSKWSKINATLEKTYQEAISLRIAPTSGERAKLADIEDIRLSLKKENIEILFNALNECADISPDDPWETLPWEMKMVFCCKVIKKLDKALTSWVRGKVGRDRIRKCQFGKSLLEVPKRTENGDNTLFQTEFNTCSAETKRWKSPIHAIPRGSELSEMIIPRYNDSILTHFDYSQIEVRMVAALSNEKNLINLFKTNPKADIHRLMASRVWNKAPEDVSGEERRASKGCCLAGDTRVRLLDGTVRTLKDLEGHNGFYVYTVNQVTGEMEPGKVTWCGKVKIAQKYVKITLDDGGIVQMDLDHQLVRKDGIGVSGRDLKIGTLLQSIETGINHNNQIGRSGYEYIINPNGKRNTIYRQVCLQNNEYKYKYNVHHKDHNIFNNCPDNLDYITSLEHTTYHSIERSKHYDWGGFVIWDDDRRKTISDMMIEEQQDFRNSRGYVGSTSVILRYIRNLLENGFVDNIADVYNKYRTTQLLCRWENLPKFFDASYYDIIQNAWHIKWGASETHPVKELDTSYSSEQGKNQMKRLWESDTLDSVEFRKRHSIKQNKIMSRLNQDSEIIKIQQQCKIMKALKTLSINCSDSEIISNYQHCHALNKTHKWVYNLPKLNSILKYFGSLEEALERSKSYINHEIVSIEIINEKIDLYDMRVPGNNNYWILTSDDQKGKYSGIIHLNTFGLLYGMNTESLANSYFEGNVTVAKDVVSKFYGAYPNILKWCNTRHAQVDSEGYVNTLFGDKIYIKSKSRGETHRRSQNYPVQSSASNIAGYAIWNVYEHCQKEGIEAIPQCFIHDSSDWDVRLKDLVRFIKAVNKCAVDDIVTEFDIPMKIDFEIGINLNFTMHLENPEFTENGVKFDFKCPEIFYKKLIKRLQIAYTIKGEMSDSKTEVESWANIFVTKRPYSMYLNRPIEIYAGNLILEHKI